MNVEIAFYDHWDDEADAFGIINQNLITIISEDYWNNNRDTLIADYNIPERWQMHLRYATSIIRKLAAKEADAATAARSANTIRATTNSINAGTNTPYLRIMWIMLQILTVVLLFIIIVLLWIPIILYVQPVNIAVNASMIIM